MTWQLSVWQWPFFFYFLLRRRKRRRRRGFFRVASSGGWSVAEKSIVAVPRGVALERAVGWRGRRLETISFIFITFISFWPSVRDPWQHCCLLVLLCRFVGDLLMHFPFFFRWRWRLSEALVSLYMSLVSVCPFHLLCFPSFFILSALYFHLSLPLPAFFTLSGAFVRQLTIVNVNTTIGQTTDKVHC